ncbi:unnamed protein product [Symbiodinium microadriaticum]|nr:unnamed protein product [Symbiodinium microadriaticum]
MVTPKKRRGDLEVPPFVLKEWNKGSLSRDDMADLLLQHNGNKETFLSDLEVQIKKKNKIILYKDQGWYSEAEMRSELKWSAPGP